MLRLGLDIGGTKTGLIALESGREGGREGMRELLRRREPTPHGDYDAALDALVAMVRVAEADLGGRASLGIGVPGLVSPVEGVVRNSFATPYNERPLKRDLERRLGRELRIENDANCFALAEARDGAGRGARQMFGAVLGTGAGGAVTAGGRLLPGANASAGEWGHNPLPWMTREEFPGPLCTCGRHGCIEQFVSGSALAQDHERVTGASLAAERIVEGAGRGEPACEQSLARLEERLGRAFAHVINLLDPDLIVLGGGLSSVDRLYTAVPRHWRAHAYSGGGKTRLVRAVHGPAAGARGAALLWED